MRRTGWLIILGSALLSGACHNMEVYGSTPISIQEGLALVERDLARTNPIVLSDVERNPSGVAASIFAAQCLSRTSNPPVPVITAALSVALTGTFTSTPSAQIGWSAGPAGQLGFQVAKGETQSLTIPVTFVSASSLPNVYLWQNLALLTGFDAKDPNKAKLVKEFVGVRDHLKYTVDHAIDAYPADAENCPKTVDQALVPPSIPSEE